MSKLLKISFIAICLFMSYGASAQLIKTNMLVTVLDSKGNVQRGATVKIYETEEDYDEDQNVVATVNTDEKGQAKFKKLKTQSYFIRVQNGKLTNDASAAQTGGLIEKRMNKVNVIISEEVKKFKMN